VVSGSGELLLHGVGIKLVVVSGMPEGLITSPVQIHWTETCRGWTPVIVLCSGQNARIPFPVPNDTIPILYHPKRRVGTGHDDQVIT
jgi:hypothetical protein